MTTNKEKLATDLLIKSCEGLKLKAYKDSVGKATIGCGTIKYPDGTLVKMGDTCTQEQAFEWLNDHLSRFIYPVVDALQAQYGFSDAVYCSLCSFAYNLGTGALKGDSIVSALQSGNLDNLATAFRKYVKAGGQVIQGLVNRREIEIKHFMEG